jgi:anaerobic selenocysteine-containing dehydrogenase
MGPSTQHTFCRICESLCGLEVTLQEGQITKIEPDEAHVATRGFGCPKGLKQHHLGREGEISDYRTDSEF